MPFRLQGALLNDNVFFYSSLTCYFLAERNLFQHQRTNKKPAGGFLDFYPPPKAGVRPSVCRAFYPDPDLGIMCLHFMRIYEIILSG